MTVIADSSAARAWTSGALAAAPAEALTARIALTTPDGLRLQAWYALSRNRAGVIVFPGRSGSVRHARMLIRHGSGVLMLDRRGEAASEGEYNARGWSGEPDLEAALDYLAARSDADPERIGDLGLSVGGELPLQAAARDSRLNAVVSEGAGRQSLDDQMQIPDVPNALRWLSPMTMETAAGIVLSNRSPRAARHAALRRGSARRLSRPR